MPNDRRTGRQSKIERLPEDLQQRINALLADGSWTYQRIIEVLQGQMPDGVYLTRSNLSAHWKKRVEPMLENRRAMREAFLLEEEVDKEGQVDMARVLNFKLMSIATQIAHKIEEMVVKATLDDELFIDEELMNSLVGLTKTLKGLEQAGRVNQQREQHIAQEAAQNARQQAAQIIDKAAKDTPKGISREAAAAIKQSILGV